MSAVKTWVVRVYDENEKLVARWHIEDRTEREAQREAEADINREYPGCDWTLTPSTVSKLSRGNRMEAKEVVAVMLEAEEPEPDPEQYLRQLPAAFDAAEVMDRIQNECAYCMDSRADKQAFMKWIKDNEDLFPDVAKALEVVQRNDSWCTDSEDDMWAFFEQLGHRLTDDTCPKCAGSGQEPGAPADWDEAGNELVAVCDRCQGTGRILTHCECDNTHQANDTVCRWCWARGRRHFNDPPV